MREVHPIPTAMVQPWMIMNVLAELVALSFGVPAMLYLFTRWMWSAMLIPILLIVAYRVTAKDMFRLAVMYASLGKAPRTRSLKFWKGAKTYVPR